MTTRHFSVDLGTEDAPAFVEFKVTSKTFSREVHIPSAVLNVSGAPILRPRRILTGKAWLFARAAEGARRCSL